MIKAFKRWLGRIVVGEIEKYILELENKVKVLEEKFVLLEAQAHPPIFTLKERNDMLNRLDRLEIKRK